MIRQFIVHTFFVLVFLWFPFPFREFVRRRKNMSGETPPKRTRRSTREKNKNVSYNDDLRPEDAPKVK